jgi:3-hydroxyisobutyrate dehydrogenase-like beta-hydroxyacid dehydrogenase
MEPLAGQTVGLIGLGLMGRPMALNLHRAGARLVVHSRSRGVVDEFAAMGMTAAASPAAVAAAAPVVVLMLPDTPAVGLVLFGESGVVGVVKPGSLVIDMGTTRVADTRRFAAAVAEAGGDYADAPVSGGTIGAERGTLTIMAGGTEAAIARAVPVFAALGERTTNVGTVGAGQVAKALTLAAGEPGTRRDANCGEKYSRSRMLADSTI